LKSKKKNKKQNKKKTLTAATKKTYRLDPAKTKTIWRNGPQPGRIIETVNSDNNKNVTRRSHRRVSFFGAALDAEL
jgi:hypothetical protein